MTEPRRNPTHGRREALNRKVRVSGEELVGAVAAERDGHPLPLRAAHEIGRQQRRIGKRFAEPRGDRIAGVEEIALAELDDLVPHAEMPGNRRGVRRLVEAAARDPDGKGRCLGRGLHRDRGNQA